LYHWGPLYYRNEYRTTFNRIAFFNENLINCSGACGIDIDFHLHGFENNYYLVLSLTAELNRLEYYISLLPKEEAEVIRWFYFDQWNWSEITERSQIPKSTAQRRKRSGISKLVGYYSILDKVSRDNIDIRTRTRFISCVHEKRFVQCLKRAGDQLNPGGTAMLYIISGFNELWNIGVETFFDFSSAALIPYGDKMPPLSDQGARLLEMAYFLGRGAETRHITAVFHHEFQDLEYLDLELAIEAVKLALFPALSE
jgi:predicted DNA-binding protein YlxM (UPF0122 family)